MSSTASPSSKPLVHGHVTELRLARAPVNALNRPVPRHHGVAGRRWRLARAASCLRVARRCSRRLDVPFLLSLGDDQAALLQAWTAFFDAARALASCPVPVVAAMAGHAPAGGCVLALCCDYRIMAEGPYRIGLNETQVGLVAPEGIQALMARGRAHRRAFAGGRRDGDWCAVRIGLGELPARRVATLRASG
jgi:enoyl-CoA hydratase/carnithine racemase